LKVVIFVVIIVFETITGKFNNVQNIVPPQTPHIYCCRTGFGPFGRASPVRKFDAAVAKAATT
jgi:hypothetical protein